MEFSIKTLSPEAAKAGCIVLGIHANQQLTPAAKRADQAARGALRKALADLPGKAGSTLLLRGLPGIAAERVLLVSLGGEGYLYGYAPAGDQWSLVGSVRSFRFAKE